MKLTVQNLSQLSNSRDLVAEVGATTKNLPYSFFNSIRAVDSRNFFKEDLTHNASNETAWVATNGGALLGLLCLKPLAWDTTILGYPAFKITHIETFGTHADEKEILLSLLQAGLASLRQLPKTHCHVRVPASTSAASQTLATLGFRKVETLNTYGANLKSIHAPLVIDHADLFTNKTLQKKDLNWAQKLCQDAVNKHDRFHADPSLIPHANAFMKAWALGCTQGFCDTHVAGLWNNSLAGFAFWQSGKEDKAALGVQISKLVLGAVSSDFKGHGIYRSLSAKGCSHFLDQGADLVQMSTQAANIAAIRSWEAIGLKCLLSEDTWSLSLPSQK